MQTKILTSAVFIVPLFLLGCGGGSTTPYDGTWAADFSALSQQSIVTPTKVVLCNTPPATLSVKDSAGTTTQTSTCTTTIIDSLGNKTTYPALVTVAYISVSFAPGNGQKDILNAIVNGVPFTGQCISNNACSATSNAGEVLGITR